MVNLSRWFVCSCLLLALSAGLALAAEPAAQVPKAAEREIMAADLSQHLIAINTSFSGAKMVLFGTVEKPSDIIVVVSGPDQSVTIRRKEKVMGLWFNRLAMNFPAVPSYYAVSATRPLYEIASPEVLKQNHIGINSFALTPAQPLPPDDLSDLTEAIIREKRASKLYPSSVEKIYFIGSHLFRASLEFPSNLPTGNFTVSIYIFQNGQIVGAQTTPLQVTPVGLSSFVKQSAFNSPIAYSLASLLIALMIGMASQYLMRKGS